MKMPSDQSSAVSATGGLWFVAQRFLVLCAALLSLNVPARAQQPSKIPRIGWLGVRPITDPGGAYEILRHELRALGYIDGKNIAYEYRSADNQPGRLPALAEELVRLHVDVIVAPAVNEAVAAKKATKMIPIVFASGGDPVAAKLVDSLARPRGNVTGYTGISAVLTGKRLELLRETVPKIARVALLWNPRDGNSGQSWKESRQAAREVRLPLHSMQVDSPDQLVRAFNEALKAGSSALVVTGSTLFSSYAKDIASLALRSHLPAVGSREDFADAGGLMSYGPDRAEPYKQAALYVDKILKGSKPADLPVVQPMAFELVINLKTAGALGVTIPSLVFMRAQRVVK